VAERRQEGSGQHIARYYLNVRPAYDMPNLTRLLHVARPREVVARSTFGRERSAGRIARTLGIGRSDIAVAVEAVDMDQTASQLRGTTYGGLCLRRCGGPE
jgi:hypothetical protein